MLAEPRQLCGYGTGELPAFADARSSAKWWRRSHHRHYRNGYRHLGSEGHRG